MHSGKSQKCIYIISYFLHLAYSWRETSHHFMYYRTKDAAFVHSYFCWNTDVLFMLKLFSRKTRLFCEAGYIGSTQVFITTKKCASVFFQVFLLKKIFYIRYRRLLEDHVCLKSATQTVGTTFNHKLKIDIYIFLKVNYAKLFYCFYRNWLNHFPLFALIFTPASNLLNQNTLQF